MKPRKPYIDDTLCLNQNVYALYMTLFGILLRFQREWKSSKPRKPCIYDTLCTGDICLCFSGIMLWYMKTVWIFMTFLRKIKYLRNRRNLCIFYEYLFNFPTWTLLNSYVWFSMTFLKETGFPLKPRKLSLNSYVFFYLSYMLTCILYYILWTISCVALGCFLWRLLRKPISWTEETFLNIYVSC